MGCVINRRFWLSAHLLLLLALAPTTLSSQFAPADSLLSRPDLSFHQKVLIHPIVLYQKLSYSTSALACQFEPSCSHFMAQAIAYKGTLAGLVIGSDRLIRCNPYAFSYHLAQGESYNGDGRLLDPVPPSGDHGQLNPRLAYSLIPGFGRAMAGRPGDGLVSFMVVGTLGAVTLQTRQDGNVVGATFIGALTALFWAADFYAAGTTTSPSPGMP